VQQLDERLEGRGVAVHEAVGEPQQSLAERTPVMLTRGVVSNAIMTAIDGSCAGRARCLSLAGGLLLAAGLRIRVGRRSRSGNARNASVVRLAATSGGATGGLARRGAKLYGRDRFRRRLVGRDGDRLAVMEELERSAVEEPVGRVRLRCLDD